MTTGAVRRAMVLAIGVAVVSACSGGDDTLPSEPPITTRPPATSAPTTVASTTSVATSVATTTTAAPTSPPATSAPTSAPTSPPPTEPSTTVAADPTEAAVLAAVEGYYASWRECIRSVPDCTLDSLAPYRTTEALHESFAQIDAWQADNVFVENVDSYAFFVQATDIAEPSATVDLCQHDATVLIERDPGSSENIINDDFVSTVRQLTLVQEGGAWRVATSVSANEAIGEENDLCA